MSPATVPRTPFAPGRKGHVPQGKGHQQGPRGLGQHLWTAQPHLPRPVVSPDHGPRTAPGRPVAWLATLTRGRSHPRASFCSCGGHRRGRGRAGWAPGSAGAAWPPGLLGDLRKQVRAGGSDCHSRLLPDTQPSPGHPLPVLSPCAAPAALLAHCPEPGPALLQDRSSEKTLRVQAPAS